MTHKQEISNTEGAYYPECCTVFSLGLQFLHYMSGYILHLLLLNKVIGHPDRIMDESMEKTW